MKVGISSCKTLIQLIQFRASQSPEATAFIIADKKYSFTWLLENIKMFATKLLSEGVKKTDTVLLLAPNKPEFFISFYGTILSGAIPVPVFPKASIDRCQQLMKLCGSTHLVSPKNIDSDRYNDLLTFAKKNNFCFHLVNSDRHSIKYSTFPKISANDIAFIQYTSGSTGFPKGVPLTHKNLLTNIRQNIEAMSINDKDVFVSWLPVYHDMGLILNSMVPMYSGAGLVLLESGLHKVHSWLTAIQKYKATIIAAPDTAFQLCVKSIRNHNQYDLSSLRIALNAAEPVHLKTFRLFEEAFALKNVMIAGYGLAEATLSVTTHPVGAPPRIDNSGHVSVGKPMKKNKIKIAKSKNNNVDAGEILVKSPATMSGYYKTKQNKNPFDKNGYLKTGDIGYLDKEDYLYVLSRKKNIIILGGHTLYPDDLEEVVRTIKEIRKVMVVGIQTDKTKGESLFVFAESRSNKRPSENYFNDLVIEIVNRIFENFGIRPANVYILKPKSLPITANGKLMYSALKNVYLDKIDSFRKNILFPKNN